MNSPKFIGVALIVAPLVGLLLKFFSFGWMVVFMLFGPIFVMASGYIIQIIIAAQGFLSSNSLFDEKRLKRATIAAQATIAGILVLGFTMPDGGDNDRGSTLQVMFGAYGPNAQSVLAATDWLTNLLALVAAIAWIVGWCWLAVEWIGAFADRRKRQLGMA